MVGDEWKIIQWRKAKRKRKRQEGRRDDGADKREIKRINGWY